MPRHPLRKLAPAFLAAWVALQPPSVVVRVLDETTGRPLPNAEVVDLATGTSRLTDERGEAHLPRTPEMRVRVRQIGFQFAERNVAGDTVAVSLQRVAYRLGAVVTRDAARCDSTADTLALRLAAPALEQLRLGAERYDAFRRAYPFHVGLERRTAYFNADGTAKHLTVSAEHTESQLWEEPYRPGRLIERANGEFWVPVLFVSTLADQKFWDRHCFAVRGIESLQGERVVRLAFAPIRGIREPEWEGTALIDSATSLLRRVEFRLTNLEAERVPPGRFEGYTTFRSPSPYVAVPESTLVMWWERRRDDGSWGPPGTVQLLRLTELRYRKARPPALTP